MSVKDKAKLYYPRLWNEKRLCALVVAGHLTTADFEEITGKAYTE